MKVKRYEGNTVQEVLSKIKVDLGPEATILFIKERTRARLFRRGKKYVEAMASSQEDKPAYDAAKLEMIYWELKELKDSVKNIKVREEHVREEEDALYPVLRGYRQKLCEAGVETENALTVLKDFQERFTEKELRNSALLEESLIRHMARYLDVAGPISADENKIVAIVGSTGVGKTTTVAKLAAQFSLMERKRVALITIDTYRIAAVDQLKTYAEIIGIPIEVVFNPQELLVSLNRNKDKELILIDTAGSNPFDKVRMDDLRRFLGSSPNIETHLLLTMTTKPKNLLEIYNCYNIMKIHKVILTKLDESVRFGNILNLATRVNRPISYITTGQNVPDDIEVADPYNLVQLILKGREMLPEKKEGKKKGTVENYR
ncbi:MAG: hypothetical protein GF333_05075 [Candidatus Omnitrophica bacterium]|nr:hypothetical protein [Candidatus Omnitrophota bacterium]